LIVAELGHQELRRRMHAGRLRLRTGPFVLQLHSPLRAVQDGVELHYAHHPVVDQSVFADFHVSVQRPHGLRRWYRPQVVFGFDGEVPFTPLPGDQGMPMLEWGLNWCVSSHCHQYLVIHAAAVERGGRAVILPAPPGSGKSTLCAGLAFSGWRLLSDELTIIDFDSRHLHGLARPVSLKNASIDVLRRFAPDARIGAVVHETTKGSVAHVRPPPASVEKMDEPAQPAWVVLPKYVPQAAPKLEPLPRAQAFMHLVDNAFNYHLHGANGFAALTAMVDHCDCYQFSYGRLEDAVEVFARLADRGAP
jgi:HprK-related kinase A